MDTAALDHFDRVEMTYKGLVEKFGAVLPVPDWDIAREQFLVAEM